MKPGNKRQVLQRDSNDCGPACIVSVAGHYGQEISLSRLRMVAGTDREGTSMLGLLRALEASGFEAKGLRGGYEHLDKLPLPLIAHMKKQDGFHHYVVLYKKKGDSLKIMDPGTGQLSRWESGEFRKQWSGAVVALLPRKAETMDPGAIPRPQRFTYLLKPVWRGLVQALFSSVLYTLLGLSTSIYLGKITDYVFVTGNSGLLNLMSLVMLGICFLMIYFSISKNLVILKTGQVMDNQLISSYYRHLFSLPVLFFDSMKTGEIISRIGDAIKIRGFINDALIGIAVNFMILLFSFVTMFLIDAGLATIMLIMLPFYALIYYLFNLRNRKNERKVMEESAILEGHLVESLENSRHIRQYNLEELSCDRNDGKLNSLLKQVYRSGKSALWASGLTEFVNRVFTIILLWYGASLVIRGSITPGMLLTFYALTGYFTGPVQALISSNKAYQNAMIASDRLFEIFDLESASVKEKPAICREKFGDIVFRDVCFAYGSRGQLFNKLNLTLKAGEITALTGPSGSGKSTITSLIQQFYLPDSGNISIGGCDLRSFSPESIRKLIGVVPQHITFLSGSILSNLAPGEKEPDLFRISALLEATGLEELVAGLPSGIHTELGSRGMNFSGGERQRLALVRALYRRPALLILDEATSGLDSRSENLVRLLLEELGSKKQSILLISHKSSYSSMARRQISLA